MAETATRNLFKEPSDEINAIARATIGAAIAVHRELGPGFLENVYEEAVALELAARRIRFRRQVLFPIYYLDKQVGESRLDLLVEESLVVELKAVEELRPLHRAQLLSYLRAGAFDVGLVINFNVMVLTQGIKRVIWSKKLL